MGLLARCEHLLRAWLVQMWVLTVAATGTGCGIVLNFSGSFLVLIVFFIYLGGNDGSFWLYNGYGYRAVSF